MQVQHLSDHVGDQIRNREAQLSRAQATAAQRWETYRLALGHLVRVGRAKPWWKRLLRISTPEERAQQQQVWAARQAFDQARDHVPGIERRIQQNMAGAQGEEILVDGLAELSDEWVLLRGYRNRRGEADVVLVGPSGIWVVEVKYSRVRLVVDDGGWWYEKLDSWGNTVATAWATDRSGRSWADQVNQVAEDLARWLRRRGHHHPVNTAVMLMHEQAELGRCENPSVALVGTHPDHLLQEIREQPPHALSPTQCAQIVELIRRDHRFHNPPTGRRR